MRKFYLYTAILISLFAAGFALAEKTDLAFFSDFSEAEMPTVSETLEREENTSETLACDFTVTVAMKKAQTSCKNIDGWLKASVSGGSGSYTYEWYTDTDVFVGTGADLKGKEAGVYYVEVRDTNTGNICRKTGTIADNTPNMDYDAKVLKNVIGCDGQGFGSLSLKMLESDANNNLPHWYDENGVLLSKDGNANMVDGAWIFDELAAGTYTIIVKNANTGCEGEPFTITIGQMTPPTITGTTIDNTLCVGGDGELNLTITTDGPAPANGFHLSWTGPTSGSTSGVISTYNITNLPSGTYSVTASDPDDAACTTTETFVINDARVYPSLALDATANTVCLLNGINGGFDGTISVTKIIENGQEYTDFSNYTINWMDADGNPLAANTSGTQGLYTKLEHGSYLVSVTNSTTGCPSGQFPVEVPLTSPTLSLSLTADPQTYCSGTPDGSITATASTSGTQGYTLEWYQGNDENGTLLSVTGNTAIELYGDLNYFVKLIDTYTGCSTSQSIFVPKALVTPEISGIASDNTICAPGLTSPAVSYNGTITVTVDNAAFNESYTYTWTGDNGSSGTLSGANNITISSLQEGQYTIVATNATTACPSGELVVEVGENKIDPALSIATADNTACDPLLHNGTATVSVTNARASDTYTYEWTQNGSAIGQNTAQATGLGAGTYTVLVTNTTTGCQTSIAGTIQTVTTDPVASIGVQTAITCLLDGEMTASVVSPVANTNYTIIWYRGEEALEANKITEVAGTTSTLSTYNGGALPSDHYTVVVKNDDSGCTSEAVTEYLAPPADPFVVDLIPNKQPTLCDEESGVITAWVNDGTGSGNREITNYTFEWYEGRPTDPDASFYSDPPIQFAGSALTVDADQIATTIDLNPQVLGEDYYKKMGATNGQTLYKAKPGIYTVVVTNPNGCKALKEVKLDFPNAPEADFDITDIDQCNGTGAIKVQLTDNASPPNLLDQTDYEFYLYEGQNQTGTPTIVTPTTANQVTEFKDLPPGWYTVVAFDLQGCQTYAETVELKQLSLEPVVSISNKSPNESCGTPDGSFDITVGPKTGDNQTVAYLITITDSNGATVSLPNNGVYSVGTHTIPNLAEGDYTIVVEGIKSDGTTHTNCDTEVNTTLVRNTPLPVLTASALDQTVCSPPNGSARVTQISFNGTTYGSNPSVASDFTDFTFAWYASETLYNSDTKMTDSNGQLITGFEATGLAPRTYYVTASRSTGLSAGCPSAPAIVTVKDVSTLPVISFSTQPQSDCGAPNGTLTATALTNGSVGGHYTFEWFVGKDNTTDAFTGTLTSLSPNKEEISNLESGFYTVRVTEGTAPYTCTPVVKTYEVGSTISQPQISGFGTPMPNNVCNYDGANTFPNGSFTVNSVTYNSQVFTNTSHVLNDEFTFTLFEEDPTLNPNAASKPASSSIIELAPGTYYLVATKKNPAGVGCGQTPFIFTIEDKPVRPVFSILNGTASNACPGGEPNGTLEAKIALSNGSAPPASDYTVEWYQVTADGTETILSTAVPTAVVSSPSAGNLLVEKLPAGKYKAVATLNDYGCPVTATYTIGQENFDFSMTTNQVAQVGCINGGSISIPTDGITINGNQAALSEFTFNWYRKDADGTTLITGLAPNTTNLNVANYPAIEAGTYIVEALKKTNPAAGCGPRVTVEIPYVDAMPAITVNLVRPVSGCNPDSKGLIDITVSSPLGNPLEVSWFTNTQYDESGATDQAHPGGVITYNSGDQVLLENLESGYYRVEVKDTDPAIQCTTSRIFFIDEQSATAVMSASAQDAWKCSPPNGEIFVLMDNREAYSQVYPNSQFDITIERQEDDFTDTKLLDIALTDTLTFKGLGIGTYFVHYKEKPELVDGNWVLLSGCEITSDTVQILDSSTPVLPEIEQTTAYNVCDPAQANGALSAYALVNGTRTTQGYSFAWYEGEVDETTTDQPFDDAATVSSLKDTTYTVIVTRDLTGCTAVAHYTITDESVPFSPSIVQDVLLTNCDPALANAELIASVGDSTTGYTFEWFLGEANLSTPAAEALFTQARATGLRDTIYTVRVTNPLTGCQGLASHTIEVDYPVIPVDSSWIVSTPSTSCQYQTGSLEVGVDSLYTNYSFTWYKGPEAHPDSLLATDVYKLDSLAPGIYTITITSAENGCTSTAFTKEVGEDYYFPKYQITIKPSTCIEEGTASIIDVEGKIPFYEWYYEDKLEPIATNGPFSGPAGNYWLKIVSDLGCVKWVPVEINSVVDPYNAVSINGDGKNDYFHIDCIEMFPQNRVRIYNRAGTLVFEVTGYDNSLNSFNGVGNRGLYFNGKELPVGTYYYYVDKRHKDEKPQTGFLELLR